jgi:hypothetical protein
LAPTTETVGEFIDRLFKCDRIYIPIGRTIGGQVKDMRDVTDLMNRYRDCSRHVWNTYMGTEMGDAASDAVERIYDQIRRLLFDGIVTVRLTGTAATDATLIVAPMPSVPILIRRPSGDGNYYWDQEPELRFEDGLVQLTFIEYYDFFEGPVRDFRFYRCRVMKFPTRPEYEGRDALVDVVHARVFYYGPTEQGTPKVSTR